MDSEAVKKLATELDISGCGSLNLEVSLGPRHSWMSLPYLHLLCAFVHTMLQHGYGTIRSAGMTHPAGCLCRNSSQPQWTASAR